MKTDLPYIEQISKRLWTGREIGRAAVMVGSGFSLNAEAVLPNSPPFPLWGDLGRRMYQDLYSPGSIINQGADGTSSYPSAYDALKLATEYEVVFERAALNDVIIKSIPDKEYNPGRLHRLLLSLPWSDVFTTNYDTLLERTLPSIHERKYDVILTASDLPSGLKPRILKLHGSLPSHLPLIITQEDFRTYPVQFAPFVNTVQQAIMENAFCLLGFSGDDPNFLYWTGWVRDNLGKTAPPIYLCSLTEVSSSQRRVLESRNVFAIDLSGVIPQASFPDPGLRYAKTLEWFLLTLMAGAPPSRHNWPNITRRSDWTPSYALPEIPTAKKQANDLGEVGLEHFRGELSPEELRSLYIRWREQRSSHPGWVVLPDENRETLWRYTKDWMDPVLDSIDKLPAPENLLLLYELNWRLERCLIPVFDSWREKYQSVIRSFNPFPGMVIASDAAFSPDRGEYKHFDWGTISTVWVDLTFALIREARESLDENRFRTLTAEIKEVVKQKVDWQARWFYEQCLFWLLRVNHDEVQTVMNEWATITSAPFWEVKRASVLAEIGEINEAGRVAEGALASIRSRLDPYPDDYTLMSQEGWAMILLKSIKDNRLGGGRESVDQYRDRWEQLGRYRCNPWPELETSELIVKALDPRPPKARRKKRGFHPDSITISHQIIFGGVATEVRRAYSFLRMFEESALPLRSNAVSFFSEAVVNAAKCIASTAPEWSLSTMLRTAAEQEIKDWFDYIQVATLHRDKVTYLYNTFLTSFTQAARRLQSGQVSLVGDTPHRMTRLYAELLSRLCVRLSAEQLDQMFELAREAYVSPTFRQDLWQQECVGALFKGLFEALPYTKILEQMPVLLSLPIPTENGFEVAEPQKWPEPFAKIDWPEDAALPSGFDRSALSIPLNNLVRIVRDGTSEARGRAVLRLARLNDLDLLSDEEGAAFADALWSRLDENKSLPSETGMYDFASLHLPSPNTDLTREHFRRYLISGDFRRVVTRSVTSDGKQGRGIGIGSGGNRFIQDWLGGTASPLHNTGDNKHHYVEWSADEIDQLLQKAAAWWDAEKADLKEFTASNDMFFADTMREQFARLIKLLAQVVLPRLIGLGEPAVNTAMRLLQEMEEAGIQTAPALPTLLFAAPALYDDVKLKLRAKLHSANEDNVRASITGIYNWFLYSSKSSLAPAPSILLDELIQMIVMRRQPGLDSAMRCVIATIREFPELLSDTQLDDLCQALEYLDSETRLNAEPILQFADDREVIEAYERPVYRQLSVRLAYRLGVELRKRDRMPPQILDEWRKIAEADELPMIRHVWPRVAQEQDVKETSQA
jgi:hypothetical protein